MELLLASGSNRGPIIEPEEDGRSHQSVEIYQTPGLVFSPIQSQVFGPPEGKGM